MLPYCILVIYSKSHGGYEKDSFMKQGHSCWDWRIYCINVYHRVTIIIKVFIITNCELRSYTINVRKAVYKIWK